MMFDKTLAYPTERDDWVKTLLIGGVLIFFGFLIVPMLLVYGYVVRAISGSLTGHSEPPAFDEWGELLINGVQAFLVGLVYMLVPLIITSITVGGAFVAMMTGEAGFSAALGGMFFGFALSTVLGLVFGYFAVVAIVNFAREGRFGAAFDVETITTVALSRDYAVAWLVSVVVFVVAGIVGSIPLVGWLVTPFVSFYAAVVAANLWAGGFAQTLESTADVDPTADGETAI